MKKTIGIAVLGVAGLLFLFSGPLWAQGAVVNGDFETDSLAPFWATTGGTSNLDLMLFAAKPGLASICLRRELGPSAFNGAIEQPVYLMGGISYVFTADIAAQYCASWGGVNDGGRFAVTIDGTSVAKYSFGSMGGTKFATLSGTYAPAASGMYNLKIENTCTIDPSDKLYNYIDGITIKPEYPDLEIQDINIPSQTGGTATLELKGGLSKGGKDYWVWMSVTGNDPGIQVGGMTVPLNWDALFQFGLFNPDFPGSTGFVGKLDFFGMAEAQLTLPPDPQHLFMNVPIYFAYVLTAPGPKLPLSYVSTPVHIKYVP